jgi:hypothetical protein
MTNNIKPQHRRQLIPFAGGFVIADYTPFETSTKIHPRLKLGPTVSPQVKEIQAFFFDVRIQSSLIDIPASDAGRRGIVETVNTLDETAISPGLVGAFAKLRFGTSEIGGEDPFSQKWWHHIGVRVRGLGSGSKVLSISTEGKDDNNNPVTYTVEANELANAGNIVDEVREFVVPGYGYGKSCKVVVEARGDIVIDNVTLYYDEGMQSW